MSYILHSKEEEDTADLDKIAKTVKNEIKEIPKIKDMYPVLDSEKISKNTLQFYSYLHQYLQISAKNEKAVTLISSIITTLSTSKSLCFQVALGVLL